MQDPPAPAKILDLAIAQLGALDAAQPRAKFELRMVAAALQLVKRAMDGQAAAEAEERRRLAALLTASDDLEALNRRLCAALRSGALSLSSPGVAAHLRATAMEKLAIDQPNYSAYRRALETQG